MADAMSGDTPAGSPDGVRPVTSRKLPMLMAARSTPCGASSETMDWDMQMGPEDEDAAVYRTARWPQVARRTTHGTRAARTTYDAPYARHSGHVARRTTVRALQ